MLIGWQKTVYQRRQWNRELDRSRKKPKQVTALNP